MIEAMAGTMVSTLSLCYMLWCMLDTFRIKQRMTKRANEFDSDVKEFTGLMQQDVNYFNDERKMLEDSQTQGYGKYKIIPPPPFQSHMELTDGLVYYGNQVRRNDDTYRRYV
jgi:hypothetical protein